MEDGPFGAMPNVRALRIFRCDEPRKFVLAHGAEREGRALVGEKNMCARERMRANTLTRMELEVFSMVKLKNTHWSIIAATVNLLNYKLCASQENNLVIKTDSEILCNFTR